MTGQQSKISEMNLIWWKDCRKYSIGTQKYSTKKSCKWLKIAICKALLWGSTPVYSTQKVAKTVRLATPNFKRYSKRYSNNIIRRKGDSCKSATKDKSTTNRFIFLPKNRRGFQKNFCTDFYTPLPPTFLYQKAKSNFLKISCRFRAIPL